MYRFHDAKVDTNLFLQLQDLSTVLVNNPHFTFEFNYGSFIDVIDYKITASRFWDNTAIKEVGLKTDVFLRAIGTFHYSDVPALQAYVNTLSKFTLPKFGIQLVTLLEDIRLEEIVKKIRPGTSKLFSQRRNYFVSYFENQLATNVTRSYLLDELFCLIYLLLQADEPDPSFPRANQQQLDELESLKPFIYASFEAKDTQEITRIATQIITNIATRYPDMLNEYFIFPISRIGSYARNTLFDELTRTDALANDDRENIDEEKNEFIDEKFSTWHRESKTGDTNQTFLQFELDQGTKTSLIGDGARETEEGDQAMASIQGASSASKQNDYSKLESLDQQDASKEQGAHSNIYGKENKDAVKLIKEANAPSKEDEQRYNEFVADIEAYKRKLATTIEKMIEHKRNAPRKDLLVGRLSKNLLPIVMEENPRVFYQKNQEAKEMDAVFTLLIDCSASMFNKMDETKKGVVLFHEVLNQLKIPHSIIGFWEDANEVRENYQPNYLHRIHSYTDSFYQKNGAKIMQLEPQEDNRDGFSIRVVTKEMETRREKHKFLLVFSDGEPAAANYDQNGIVDTHQAVSEARKKGIEVIGMFLANGEIGEREDNTMKNIYGKEHIMIPSVSELPAHFTPLLKKLLLKAI